MTKAQKANDGQAYGIALGQLLVLGLVQDAHIRAALAAAKANDPTRMGAELTAAGKIGAGFNAKLDAAGLRDCGSNQP